MNVDQMQPTECDACGYPTPALTFHEPVTVQEPAWLCAVCAATPIGEAFRSPNLSRFAGQHEVLRALGFIANLILDRLPPAFPDVGEVLVKVPPGVDPRELADCGVDEPT